MKSPGKFRTKVCLAVALAVSGGSYVTLVSSQLSAEEAAAPAGLTGILPDVAPVGLLEDEFLALGDSWAEWSSETAAEIAKLYETEQDIAAQRAVIAGLKKRISTMDSALSDVAYRPIFDQLATLRGRLARRVEVAGAILDTLELDPEASRAERLEGLRSKFVGAIDDLDSYLAKIENGGAWTKYVKAAELRKLTVKDGAADVLATVHGRLADSKKFTNDDQRKFVQAAQFVRLKDSLAEYIALANTATKPVDKAALRAQFAALVSSLEAYEEFGALASAREARIAYSKIRDLAADGGAAIADTLSSHYFNYNLRVVASESCSIKSLATLTRTQAQSTTSSWERRSTGLSGRQAVLAST